jgi:hypothetical protein
LPAGHVVLFAVHDVTALVPTLNSVDSQAVHVERAHVTVVSLTLEKAQLSLGMVSSSLPKKATVADEAVWANDTSMST